MTKQDKIIIENFERVLEAAKTGALMAETLLGVFHNITVEFVELLPREKNNIKQLEFMNSIVKAMRSECDDIENQINELIKDETIQ